MKKILFITALWTLICCLPACKHNQKTKTDSLTSTEIYSSAPPPVSSPKNGTIQSANEITLEDGDGYTSSGAGMALKKEEIVMQQDRFNTEGYDHIQENEFKEATKNPLSTFSIDVD